MMNLVDDGFGVAAEIELVNAPSANSLEAILRVAPAERHAATRRARSV